MWISLLILLLHIINLYILFNEKQIIVEQYNQLASSIIPEIDMLQVQEIISIGSIITNDNDTTKIRNIHCHAFIYQDTMLMTLPDIMSQKMDQSKFYSWWVFSFTIRINK